MKGLGVEERFWLGASTAQTREEQEQRESARGAGLLHLQTD